MKSQTLTQVQENAIAYLLKSKTPDALRTRRKAGRIVLSFCETQGYSAEDQAQCVRDMLDVYALERLAE